ncbi:C4-dicarboxylate anaerobic carrier family protein, partial [Vibrio parahaemolyticus AQ3810]
MKVWFQV